ncbi:FxLYD domain-containing protein [Herbaspirillum sp. RV1423]|uniref:FxLYD domain-containing protein n=1 Tax=Herbaspirillum sp. RV1423 TaxID=1443993 RepID=UPI00055722BF|nr:FxLYD domain-containing protein [Herbaspirillum sp. RV1423]
MKKISLLAAGMLLAIAAYAQQSDKVSVRDMGVAPGPAPQARYLVGTATNVTPGDLKTVILEFNLFDAQNAQVGNASAVTQNLAAGGAWKFQALTVQPFDHAKLARITAY